MTATAHPPARVVHPVAGIITGERGGRSLGDLDELKAAIACGDLTHPVVLTPGRHLILGARRLAACASLGWTGIPAVTVTGIWQALDRLEREHADPRCAHPLTVADAMGMDMALRELQWWPRIFPQPGEPATGRSVGRERRKRISSLLGLTVHQYVEARELWQAARGYRETFGSRTPVPGESRDRAAALIGGITTAADISHAYRLYRKDTVPPAARLGDIPAAPVRSTRGDGRRSPQRTQADQIQQGLTSMTGTLKALMGIRDPGVTAPAGDLAGWADDVTDLIRDLSAFRRRLSKGQN